VFAAVDLGVQLEFARNAMRIAKVAQRRAAEVERPRKGSTHRRGKALTARKAEFGASRAWVDASFEQGLTSIDIARADDDRS